VSADFFGRPRFLAGPSLFAGAFGIGAGFFGPADPDGRPRFLFDGVSFGTITAGFFGGDVPDGRPRFLLTGSLPFS
jgi:hypothetical protein